MGIKIGLNQLSNPTPSSVSNPIDIFSGIAGVVVAWLVTASFIPNDISNIISSILGLLIGIAQVIKPFVGVKISASSVPTEDVKTIDTSGND